MDILLQGMVDFCIFCLNEAVDLDDWFLKTIIAHGKIAIIECICPWCVKEIIESQMIKDEQ